jgi:carboxyl-terminal processing protease
LTTARYYTPSGRSIQAKGIDPDVVVEQTPSPDAQGKEPPKPFGESNLRGHLKSTDGKDQEQSGSSSYVPQDPQNDKQLQYAVSFLRGSAVEATASEGQKQPASPEKKAD